MDQQNTEETYKDPAKQEEHESEESLRALIEEANKQTIEKGILSFPPGEISDLRSSGIEISIPKTEEVKEKLVYTYLVYKIIITITDKEDRKIQFTVHRRYSDFDWLFQYLSTKYVGHIVPLPPPKNVLTTIGQGSSDFVETRKRELIVFMGNCIKHQFLRKVPELITFLSDDKGFLEMKKKDQSQKPNKLFSIFSNIGLGGNGSNKDQNQDANADYEPREEVKKYRTMLVNLRKSLEFVSFRMSEFTRMKKREREAVNSFMRELEKTLSNITQNSDFENIFRKITKAEAEQIDEEMTKDLVLYLERDLKDLLSQIEAAQIAIDKTNKLAKEAEKWHNIVEDTREKLGEDTDDERFIELEDYYKGLKEESDIAFHTLMKELDEFQSKAEEELNTLFKKISKRKEHYFEEMKLYSKDLFSLLKVN